MSEYTIFIFKDYQVLQIYHFNTFEKLCAKITHEQIDPEFEEATDALVLKGIETIAKIYY